MRNRKTQGFTLIELLIVIAIIGILAAVLIPNLLSARQRAFDTASQSCAKAIATGQEIRVIDGQNYLSVPAGAVTGSIAGLEGTNTCDGITLSAGSATGQTAYSATVRHPSGSRDVVVTQDGIN